MIDDINWQPGQTLEEIEEAVITKAFRYYQGNKTATARSLDIAIRTLENKLEKYSGGSSGGVQEGPVRIAQRKPEGIHPQGGDGIQSVVEVSEKQTVPVRKQRKV